MPLHLARATLHALVRGLAPLPHTAVLPLAASAALAACDVVAPAPAAAQEVTPTSPARYVPPPGYRSKEFTFVRDQGLFHVFYLRDNPIPGAPAQKSFGHAISRDLYTWTEQDTILPVVPGTFEGTQVWAPTLHRIGGQWVLFYPGMRHEPANGYYFVQSITSATSPDLYTWTRRTTPLFDNTLFPWAYVNPQSAIGSDCRDPFVWWDPVRGEWIMYVAARPAALPNSMVIGIAGSTDLEHWSDRGQMPLSLPNVSFSDVAESPHVFSRDGSLLLILWTTDAGQSLTYGRSTDAVTGWNTSRRLRSMLGHTTAGWWASEMVKDGDRWYFANVYDTFIDFWDATWTANDTFRVSPPDSLQLLTARFSPDTAAPGDTLELEVTAVHAAGRKAWVRLTRREGASTEPLVPADFALPDSIALTGDTTRVPCVVPGTLTGRFSIDLDIRSGSVVADTLLFAGPLDRGGGDDPVPVPEPPIVRIAYPERGIVRFVRAEAAPASAAGRFVVEVRDVRGRRVWRGEGDGFARALDWPTGGAARGVGPGVARVPAGVYFARALVPGRRAPVALKVVVLN